MRHAQLSIRITFGLLAIAVSVLLMAVLLGLVSPGSLSEQAWFGSARDPRLSLFLFYATALFAAFYCYLSRSLQTWDPARAVPARVQSALDTLSDGVIVLDEFECLVLVNASFAQLHGKPAAELVGLPASLFAWTLPNNSHELLPWQHSLRTGEECHDRRIGLKMNPAEPRIFRVNSTPLRDEQGRLAGAMATFVDVTTMERGRQALCDILRELSDSRDDIKRQNQELQVLATFDPLTNCLNRRAFFEKFETHWKNADRYKVPLTCLMVDLDHFKSINDRFGHPAGDQVLQRVGQVLLQTARDSDLVCRYGGEEFCVLMPHTNLEQGTLAARRIHTAIAEVDFGAFQVTASIGLAERDLQHRQPHDLLNEADRCLYLAKNSGRNRIVVHDEATRAVLLHEPPPLAELPQEMEGDIAIPFHAVAALFSALSFRDAATAEHSRRVADLCVQAGEGLLPHRQLYVLEVAALLHDIGKIGVPDAILLKPGALGAEEREVMSSHSRMGVEILHSAFSCPQLTEIVRSHTRWFAGDLTASDLPSGAAIPRSARLLRIADAFDSMISPRVYRPARTCAEACAELRRFAGTQFDPELVEHFIAKVGETAAAAQPQIMATVSPQTALNVGLEIQRLAEMIDSQDLCGVCSVAGRLRAIAEKQGIDDIALVAAQLEGRASEHADLAVLLETVRELLNLCRHTQRAYLASAQQRRSGIPSLAP